MSTKIPMFNPQAHKQAAALPNKQRKLIVKAPIQRAQQFEAPAEESDADIGLEEIMSTYE